MGNLAVMSQLAKTNAAARDPMGAHTPLTAAVTCGDARAVEMLLQLGADPAQRNGAGVTPVICAASRGHMGILKVWPPVPLWGSPTYSPPALCRDLARHRWPRQCCGRLTATPSNPQHADSNRSAWGRTFPSQIQDCVREATTSKQHPLHSPPLYVRNRARTGIFHVPTFYETTVRKLGGIGGNGRTRGRVEPAMGEHHSTDGSSGPWCSLSQCRCLSPSKDWPGW